MKRTLAAVIAALLTAGTASAAYRLAAPKPMEEATTYSPVSGGHASEATYAYDASGVDVYSVAATSIGMTSSERGGNRYVGDAISPPDGVQIDWAKFSLDLTNQPAYKEGYVFYTGSTNANERVVIANYGSFKLDWPLSGGAGTLTVTYETGIRPSNVQSKLFWTSAPFYGPGVTVSKNYGVKLFGATNLFWSAASTNQYGAPVYGYGVHYNIENNLIQAYAQENADGSWTGPVGTFVVAYYDSGSCTRYLGCTVVQVSGPDPVYLTASVGDELLPQNEFYDPTSSSYMPTIQSSQNQTDDPRAPYVFVQKRTEGQYHKKENRVYAISETLEGEVGAKKAEVYWECADAFDVFWPFEQTCYHIQWPSCPTVVLATDGDVPGVTIPDCYSPSLLSWQDPNGVARITDTTLTITGKGRFTLKLVNADQDDFWLLPLNSAYNTDDEVFSIAERVPVNVGREARPTALAGSSSQQRKLVASVDTSLAAFLYAQQSPGNNWNPNLFHATTTTDASDPFAALESSVWFVNVSPRIYDAELWWFQKYAVSGMTEPLVMPVLPQRYKAVWPEYDDAAEIVFASGRGSAAGGHVRSGKAVSLTDATATGSLRFRYVPGDDPAFTLAFAFNPAADLTSEANLTTGAVVSVTLGTARFGFDVTTPQEGTTRAVGTFTIGDQKRNVTCPTNQWTRFVVVAKTTSAQLYADERLIDTCTVDLAQAFVEGYSYVTVGGDGKEKVAAVGTGVDAICAWSGSATPEDISVAATNAFTAIYAAAALRLAFDDAAVKSDGVLTSVDAASLREFSGTGLAVLDPGAPTWQSGVFAVSDGVTPRAYVQNDDTATGYKPNIEHAIVLADNDAYSLYALRTDMNDADNPPYALVEYAENGRGAMRAFRVAMTNEWYAWPTMACTAGQQVPNFPPYGSLPSGTSPDTQNASDATVPDGTVTYRDHSGIWWARRDGTFEQYVRYIGEAGFVAAEGTSRDLEGVTLPAANLANCFPWGARPRAARVASALMATALESSATATQDETIQWDVTGLQSLQATPITVVANWPKNPKTMSVAQVLSKAEYGLPDVYDMKTCAVVFPFYGYQPDPGCPVASGELTRETLIKDHADKLSSRRVVKLIDPTCRKTAVLTVTSSFPDEYGFTLGASGNLVNRKGYYYFQDMPANVADRLFVDITSAGTGKAHLCLIGSYVENSAGTSYLRANSLTIAERDSIKAVFEKIRESATDATIKANLAALKSAVDTIYNLGDIQPSKQVGCTQEWSELLKTQVHAASNFYLATNTYQAVDHYALVAESDVKEGGDWVVLVENDGPGAESLPVSFHVLFVTNSLYCGSVLPISDANNTLSEQLTILYTAPLGKTADQYKFEWCAVDAPSDGHVPQIPSSPTDYAGLKSADAAWSAGFTQGEVVGRVSIDAVADANTGKISMKNLVNRYWTMHYQATNTACAVKGWSNWCAPTLAEGWVQRVLNAITPFSQRLADLSSNKAELKYTMPEQIGAPWEGDVALNNENLNNVGLVQLYQTILNRAESMSIAQGASTTVDATNAAVNKQLIECVARLADMHMTLGAEAYSDAQNPLIASSDGTEFPGSVFCFANQVPSLLDEELALLRGRTSSVAPALTESPFYNRLMWNFTKGVTQGEVAYVNNYNISAVDGVLDANAAAAMYPQGHGDAYGYYLSALKGYYRLLRNPAFTWGEASMMEMLVAGHVVNMDYEEEDKFAECAYNLAKIGAEVVNLTARKQWRDNSSDIQSGYFDDASTTRTGTDSSTQASVTLPQAFGYGEWACRAGYGALCNWAVANAILPADAADAVTYFKDQSIATVTRSTASSLAPLAQEVAQIENTVNSVDAGLNPLGLSSDAVPFDISPADFCGLGSGVGAKSHYEQIRERVEVALANAKTVLDYANVYGSRLRAIENEEFDASADAAEMEASYDRQLIAVYGRPFSDDIGPGKTYEQGYTGPDLYHYMYMNLAEYGLDTVASMSDKLTYYSFNLEKATNYLNLAQPTSYKVTDKNTFISNYGNIKASDLAKFTDSGKTMSFNLTADGLVAMPTSWTGTRACEGSIQAAYRSFLSAYVQTKRAQEDYDTAKKSWDWAVNTVAQTTATRNKNLYANLWTNYNSQWNSQIALTTLNTVSTTLSTVSDTLAKSYGFTVANASDPIVGVAYSVPIASVMKAAVGSGASLTYSISSWLKKAVDIASIWQQNNIAQKSYLNQLEQLNSSDFANRESIIESVRSANSSLYSAMTTLEAAYTSLLSAQQSFRTVAEEGIEILAARQQARVKQVNIATQRRYADMYARVARNAALSKFSTTFDVAQRYVFELAKVYGYETGLDTSDSASGQAFVNATIATRALGAEGVSIDSSVTDGGLWDLVNRMDTNYAQLKGRLGINNPDVSEKWFSLRYSNFRINPDAEGDAAWCEELSRHWTDDILSDPSFTAYCEPPVRKENAKIAEPGFIFEFSTSVNLAENFFGKILQGGESNYSSSDYAIKIYAAGVDFSGYSDAVSLAGGLADEPNIYLVPIGKDYMRAPLSTTRKVIGFNVVDQVLPLPFDVGETELNSSDWVSTFNGQDGTVASAAKIRRHSTLRMGSATSSTRLVGRSVWNDKWLLVIPAAEMNANTEIARERFLQYVKDIRLGIKAYSRSGN